MSTVGWRGLHASYSPGERQIMRQLPVKEQFNIHILKSATPGEITNSLEIQGIKPRAYAGNLAPSGQQEDRVPRPGTPGGLTVYTDPEDIPFGKPKRRPKVYALVWTPGRHRVYKTKGAATKALGWWKKNKAADGWKVAPLHNSAIAIKGDTREAMSLHEYDKETKERLP